MPAAVAAPIHARLAEARRRLALGLALEWGGRALLVASSAMLAGGALRWLSGHPPVDRLLIAAGVVAFAILLLWGVARRFPHAQEAAAALDHAAASRDRFATALAFGDEPADPWKACALQECGEFARGIEPARLLPIRPPWFAFWATAPFVALTLLQLLHLDAVRAAEPTAADSASAADAADSIKQLAQLAAKAATDQRDETLAQVAELLQQRAARLQDRAAKDRDAGQLALREMAALAEMLREMRAQAGRPQASPQELAALAEALSRQESTRPAAESLRRGETAAAGKQLEDLLRKMQERGNAARQMEEIARSLQEPAGRLSEAQKSEIAQQMQQAAQAAQAGKSEKMQQLLQRLAELLKQQQKGRSQDGKQSKPDGQPQPGNQGASKPMTEKALEQLIKALEQMKQGGSKQDALDSAQRGLVRIPLPGSGSGAKPGGDGPDNPDGMPSGNPGGELDRGTSKRLFSETPAPPAPTDGPARKLEGVLGDGASLQEFLAAPGGSGQATRGYRELYEAMAPAAQDALEQENIPIGSRKTVKRYFESIRPAE